jgi:hypothetical protein
LNLSNNILKFSFLLVKERKEKIKSNQRKIQRKNEREESG